MKKRFTEEQIVSILKEGQKGGITVSEVCRRYNVSEATYYKWKKKYDGMDGETLRHYKQLEAENARLKKLVAELSLDIDILKDVNSKNW